MDLVDAGERFDRRRLGDAQLGLGAAQTLGERLIVEPDQRLTDRDRIAVADEHLDHGGADFGTDRHLVARAHDPAQSLLERQASRPGGKRLDGRRAGIRSPIGVGASV